MSKKVVEKSARLEIKSKKCIEKTLEKLYNYFVLYTNYDDNG